jgi:hypothetical protein
LSEHFSSDAAPPEEVPPIPEMADTFPEELPPAAPEEDPAVPAMADTLSEESPPAAPAETPARAAPRWIAPAWFFFGIIVGIAAFAAYNVLIVKPPAPAAQIESQDPDSMRTAARQGVLEAIATLQAGGQPAAEEPQGPQEVASNAFTVRAANRQGSTDAKVTIYEFSDFQ